MGNGLRDYQQELNSRAYKALGDGKMSVAVSSPTGTGKGKKISHIAAQMAGQGKRVLVTAPRGEIVDDLRNRIAAEGCHVGVLAPWAPPDPAAPIQVGTDKTVSRRIGDLAPFDLWMPDEAHHTPAPTYGPIIEATAAARRILFSATFWRQDGGGFDHIASELIQSQGPRWFMDQGHLVECDVYTPSLPDMSGARGGRGDYAARDMEEALERGGIIGDAIRSFCKYVRPGGTAVAFCASKRHAELTAEMFNAAGIAAEVLLGEDKKDVRKGKIARLDAGTTRVLCTVDVVSEGFDLPSIDAAILLRPTKSLSLYLQQVGRALRPAAGKLRAVILDHAGNALRHGHPARFHQWSLASEDPKKRTQAKSEAGEDLSVRQCPNCSYVDDTFQVCPACGFVLPKDERIPKWRAGELRILREEEEEAAREERKRKGQSVKQLYAIMKSKRRKTTWDDAVSAMRSRREKAIRDGDELKEWQASTALREAGVSLNPSRTLEVLQ